MVMAATVQEVLAGVIEYLGEGGQQAITEYLEVLKRIDGEAEGMFWRIAAASDLETDWKIEILSQAIRKLPNPSHSEEVEQCLFSLLRDYAFRGRPITYPRVLASRFLTIHLGA